MSDSYKIPIRDGQTGPVVGWAIWVGTFARGELRYVPKKNRSETRARFQNAVDSHQNLADRIFSYPGAEFRGWSGYAGTLEALSLALPPFGLSIDWRNLESPKYPTDWGEGPAPWISDLPGALLAEEMRSPPPEDLNDEQEVG